MTEISDDRWKALSEAFSNVHERAWRRECLVDSFANALAQGLTDYAGVPVDRDKAGAGKGIEPVCFYSYKVGPAPEYDRFERKESSTDAIGIDIEGFYTFGMGIQLELQPNAIPRRRFHWSIRVKVGEQEWTCKPNLGSGQSFSFPLPTGRESVQPIVECLYASILRWLQSSDSVEAKKGIIGFISSGMN